MPLKEKKIELVSIGESDYTDDPDSVDEKEIAYKVESIKKGIEKLPDGYRVILSLYLFEDYSHREISELMNISEGTSKSQYNRAKKKLLDIISQN